MYDEKTVARATTQVVQPLMDQIANSSYDKDAERWNQLLACFAGTKHCGPQGSIKDVQTHWYLAHSGTSYKQRQKANDL